MQVWFRNLVRNSRFWILATSILLAAAEYLWQRHLGAGLASPTKLAEFYAFGSIIFLYLALIGLPLWVAFPNLPGKRAYFHALRGFGVASFLYSCLHSSFAFFGELGGFPGLGFLTSQYLIAMTLGLVTLIILALLTCLSIDQLSRKLSPNLFRKLTKLVYLAGFLVVIHLLMLGSHFADFSSLIPRIWTIALAILLLLEGFKIDQGLRARSGRPAQFGLIFVLVVALLAAASWTIVGGPSSSGSAISFLNIHAAHLGLNQPSTPGFNTAIPGLNGDPTKRYTVSFNQPEKVQPNQDTLLRFQITDSSSGNPVSTFLKLYAYPMHLIIVDSTLTSFDHIHPTQDKNAFQIVTQFPKTGLYHLYVQFQPLGGIEQQVGFTLPVGMSADTTPSASDQVVDTNLTKIFESKEVALDTHGTLRASDMTLGKDKLSFTIRDAATHQPITNLKPFMGAFGHLTMINQKTYDFIHVHPATLLPPLPDANGGPTVDFVPLGLYGSFTPGVYRIFGEFSTAPGTDFDTNFTIEVK